MVGHKQKAIDRSNLCGDLPPVITAYGLNSRAVRVVDVVGASTGLIFFGPILLIVALAIKIDLPGPVFVRETQYGSRNRRIEVLKFRLVTTGAQGDQRRPCPTWIGSVLRGSRVDELLRLINVLRGEASFFGPRP